MLFICLEPQGTVGDCGLCDVHISATGFVRQIGWWRVCVYIHIYVGVIYYQEGS